MTKKVYYEVVWKPPRAKKSRTAYISYTHWRTLCKRFKVPLTASGTQFVFCSLCADFYEGYIVCERCPLVIFKTEERIGCVRVIEGLAGSYTKDDCMIGRRYLSWDTLTSAKWFRKVYRKLKALPRVLR